MDLVKLMLLNLGIFAVLALAATRSDAALFDMSEHSGIIRGSDGNYTRISENGAMRSLTNNQTLSLLEKPVINTSKGNFPVEIQRSVPVDLNRVGKAVSKFAQKVGPLSMALAAAELVCDLAQICNSNGQWMQQANDPMPGQPNSYPETDGQWSSWGSSYVSSAELACRDQDRLNANIGAGATYSHLVVIGPNVVQCYGKTSDGRGPFYASNSSRISGCATGYSLANGTCTKTGLTESQPATEATWSSKESALNDYRFVPHLNDSNLDIPALAPSVQNAPVTKEVSKITATNRDANGNVTGTTETKTEVKISDGTDANAPNSLTVIEQNTVTNYDVNNNVINSTTNVTNPEKPAPQEVKIEFDNTSDTPLENYSVPSSFAYTSWGSGTCPADRTVSYHYGTLNLTFEPACDFAVAMNPAILAVAGFLAMFIIAGVRNND